MEEAHTQTYPKDLPLDRKVSHARLRRRKELLVGARRGLLIRLGVILLELIGFFLWRSSSLILDALSCGIDVIASGALIYCIYKADQPPDKDHPLGHGRFEPIAGLLVGFSLILFGCIAFFEQVKGVFRGEVGPSIEPIAWVIPLIALFLLEWGYRTLKKTALLKRSPALLADAIHYRIDALTSLFALVALLLAAVFPGHAHFFDHTGALAISLFMIVAGLSATKSNIHQLVDARPSQEVFSQVREAAESVDGVMATEKCHIQQYGPDSHVSLDIEVDPEMSVLTSHEITQLVRRAIQRTLPAVRDVIVHVEPFYPGDHENG